MSAMQAPVRMGALLSREPLISRICVGIDKGDRESFDLEPPQLIGNCVKFCRVEEMVEAASAVRSVSAG